MDAVIAFLKLDLLASIPQTFTYWLFCFSFLKPLPNQLIKRLLIFAFAHSIYTDLLIHILPLQLHFFNSIIAMVVLMFVLFRDLSLKKKLFLLLFALMFAICMDLVFVSIVVYGLGIPSH